jgi:mannose-6-phosphate isomerase-like protein (cupin superfamily)
MTGLFTGLLYQIKERSLAYIFHQDQLPRLEGASGGRVRTFFVNKELTKIDDMLAGVMTYTKGTASPYHYHEVCEHFYFIMEGNAQVETPEGIQPVGPGMMIFIPPEQKHRLRALTPLFYFEFQAPNRFKTHILEGTPADLEWNRVDGGVWVQT